MKKFISVLLICTMVFSLAGCSSTSTATETAEATAGDAQVADTVSASSSDIAEKLQVLVDNDVISEETLSAIVAYMEENGLELSSGQAPEMPDGEGSGSTSEKPDGENSGSAPEMPDGENSGNAPEKPDGEDSGNAPEKPDGESSGNAPEMPDGESSGNAPEKPDGENSGSAPEMPNGEGFGGALLSEEVLNELLENNIITQDDYDAITEYQKQSFSSAPGGMGGTDAQNITYAASTEITAAAEQSDGSYASETADENAVRIDTEESVRLLQPTVSKTGSSDGGDNCNFYGLNAAVLAMGGADVTITGGTVTSDADGANGVFSYGGNGGQNGAEGDGTTVTISDTTITTTGDNAGGIMTTGGGITHASNLTVQTSGRSSAAIRTDRGGGTVTVEGGSYTTSGLGSPAVYSTADISVSDAELTSELSEGVCIEGKNSVSLTDCTLTVNNTECNGNATFLDSVNIYQSMSGDADSGTSSFSMTGGSLISKSGHVFHVTNTNAVISLSGVDITNEDAEDILLSVCDDGWSGAENIAEVNADAQMLSGKILVGSNSTLTLNLSGGSSFTGCISGEITNSRGESVSSEVGTVSVTLDGTSTWTLTADTYITSFTGDASQIISNGYTLYVNGTALTGTK